MAAITDDVRAVRAVSELFIALDDALEAGCRARLGALAALYRRLGSYDQVARTNGLSKSRVAQLYRDAVRRVC